MGARGGGGGEPGGGSSRLRLRRGSIGGAPRFTFFFLRTTPTISADVNGGADDPTFGSTSGLVALTMGVSLAPLADWETSFVDFDDEGEALAEGFAVVFLLG